MIVFGFWLKFIYMCVNVERKNMAKDERFLLKINQIKVVMIYNKWVGNPSYQEGTHLR